MRDCRSLALTVSSLSVMPVAFLHSCVIGPLSSVSEAGTKSAQRSQWTVVSWARAGARPLARMAAMPPVCAATAPDPDNFRKLRRAMRVMISSRHCCAIVVRWNYASSVTHLRAPRCRLPTTRLDLSHSRRGFLAGPCPAECSPGATLLENTPIQLKPQPQPHARRRTRSGKEPERNQSQRSFLCDSRRSSNLQSTSRPPRRSALQFRPLGLHAP